MQKKYKSDRLVLHPLNLRDSVFIFELLNTPGWLQFIGDRNIHSTEDARSYIQKIMDNPETQYWVARLESEKKSIGLISFMKRRTLDHHDIGFAFLPAYCGKGYAFESSGMVLTDLLTNPLYKTILATTMADNQASIRLIEKIGLRFNREIEHDGTKLLLYSITSA
jgi:ribosomal-protein-alanine N-acetyltransferase